MENGFDDGIFHMLFTSKDFDVFKNVEMYGHTYDLLWVCADKYYNLSSCWMKVENGEDTETEFMTPTNEVVKAFYDKFCAKN